MAPESPSAVAFFENLVEFHLIFDERGARLSVFGFSSGALLRIGCSMEGTPKQDVHRIGFRMVDDSACNHRVKAAITRYQSWDSSSKKKETIHEKDVDQQFVHVYGVPHP